MRLIIEQEDFRRLSADTQKELIERFAGKPKLVRNRAAAAAAKWAQPVDLTLPMVRKLVHGLTEDQQRRLRLFAGNGGRVGMQKLLAVTGETDWHVLSQWQGVITRRLRRLLGDSRKKAYLISWDYDATTWDKDHKNIVDGVYFVTAKTAQALRRHFEDG